MVGHQVGHQFGRRVVSCVCVCGCVARLELTQTPAVLQAAS